MTTFFDVVTVTCFAALVIGFFQFTDRNSRILIRLMLAGIVFAVANQVGNRGGTVLALVFILAGAAYAVLVFFRR
jgi:hypothetical protein